MTCFAHQYRPIDPEDVFIVLAHHWEQLGRTYDPADPVDFQWANVITTITGGNFRLMTQIARVMAINQLQTVASEVVHAARQILVVGTQWDNGTQ